MKCCKACLNILGLSENFLMLKGRLLNTQCLNSKFPFDRYLTLIHEHGTCPIHSLRPSSF